MLGRVAVAALILIAVLAGPARAADYQAGVAAYEHGDYATAANELRPLAEQGHAQAQALLGLMYVVGWGVAQDYAEAVKWYRRAAEQGDVVAQKSLGAMYNEGFGVPQDYAEALKWYRLAAEQGDVTAQYKLGVMYQFGHGVAQDYVEAHKWFNLSASGQSWGKFRDMAVKNRDTVEKFMTPAQLAEAQRLAREWKPKVQAGN